MLHCDGNSVLHVAASKMTHDRAKHTRIIKYYFIWKQVSTKEVELVKVDSKLNPQYTWEIK